MNKIITSLLALGIATGSVIAEDKGLLEDAKVSGFAEFRYTDFDSAANTNDTFEFNHAHIIFENSRDDFSMKLDVLWTDATSTTMLEEAWVEWNGHDAFNVKAGRFVNSSYWNDNRYVTQHLTISAPQLHQKFIPLFTTGLQVNGELGSQITYEAAYGNGKDGLPAGDNNDSKATFLKATWKLENHKHGLWLSAARYDDTADVKNAAGAVLRTNDYEAWQYEAGFNLWKLDVVGSYAKSEVFDRVTGLKEDDSWYIQPSLELGNKLTLVGRWEDFGVRNVVAATDKETRVVGLHFALSDDVVLKVERAVDDFDLAAVRDVDTTLFSLGMTF